LVCICHGIDNRLSKTSNMTHYDNRTIFCSKCQKLRYMGYTDKPDSELCTCSDQDNIPTVVKYKAFMKMNWKDKMDAVIKDVLGIEYTCVVNSENSFSIYENNERIAGTTSAENLKSHWRQQLSHTLEIIHKQKIQKALSKI